MVAESLSEVRTSSLQGERTLPPGCSTLGGQISPTRPARRPTQAKGSRPGLRGAHLAPAIGIRHDVCPPAASLEHIPGCRGITFIQKNQLQRGGAGTGMKPPHKKMACATGLVGRGPPRQGPGGRGFPLLVLGSGLIEVRCATRLVARPGKAFLRLRGNPCSPCSWPLTCFPPRGVCWAVGGIKGTQTVGASVWRISPEWASLVLVKKTFMSSMALKKKTWRVCKRPNYAKGSRFTCRVRHLPTPWSNSVTSAGLGKCACPFRAPAARVSERRKRNLTYMPCVPEITCMNDH